MDDTKAQKRKFLSDILNTLGSDPPATTNATSTSLSTEAKRPRTDGENEDAGTDKSLGNLPQDLFGNIVCHLTPDDLLSLREVSVFFKAALSSDAYWTDAERACGLPECPPDLSHWQYASWIFGKDCMACRKFCPTRPLFIFRARLCQGCFQERIKMGYKIIPRDLLLRENISDIFALAPCLELERRHRVPKWGSKFRYQERAYHNGCSIYYQPTLTEAYTRYLSLPTESERREFVSQRREVAKRAKELAETLDEWDKKWTEDRNAVVSPEAQKTQLRTYEVRRRLKKMGYSDADLDPSRDFVESNWNRIIARSLILTEKSWNRHLPKLRDTIFLRMINTPGYSVRRKHAELFRIMKELFPAAEAECFVTLQSILRIPAVQDAINPSVPFRDTHLCALKKAITNASSSFSATLQVKCASLLTGCRDCRPASTWPSDIRAVCFRPTAFFIVWERPQHYHVQLKTFEELLQGIKEECQEALVRENAEIDWVFESRISAPPAFLINALYDSLQISASSHEEMAALGSRFRCLRCIQLLPGRMAPTMTWVELVRHFYDSNTYFFRKHGNTWSLDVTSDPANNHGTNVQAHSPLACDVTQVPNGEVVKDFSSTAITGILKDFPPPPPLSYDLSSLYYDQDYAPESRPLGDIASTQVSDEFPSPTPFLVSF